MVTPPFKFIAGSLCLDFVNIVGAWADGAALREKLARPEDLNRWSQLANVAGTQAPVTGAIFRRAIALRQALYWVFTAAVGRCEPSNEDLQTLNRELAAAQSKEFLAHTGTEFRLQFPEAPERVLWAVVRSAADLLTSEKLGRLRQCPGEDCGWLFLDTSRNGMRQWCEMRVCGNRAKARKFRERSRPRKATASKTPARSHPR